MTRPTLPDPAPGDARAADMIETVIVPRMRDIGGFEVRRALPGPKRGMVGPFIFLDQMGPAEFILNEGLDVKPHPHINLATVTYLFDGEITHRDSLGTKQVIRPGAVNWMQAGRGIVHSERSGAEVRQAPSAPLFGLQTWVALPKDQEETDPSFSHIEKSELPQIDDRGVQARIVAGHAWGQTAPTPVASDTLYVDVTLNPGACLPVDAEHEERAAYIASGAVTVGEDRFAAGQLVIFKPSLPVTIENQDRQPARLMLVGGETMDGPRYIWWNFVSSRADRIEQAKADWKAKRFDSVPGDEKDYTPLPPEIGRPRAFRNR